MRFLTLLPFLRAHSSPHLLLSAPSSPHLIFKCSFEPSSRFWVLFWGPISRIMHWWDLFFVFSHMGRSLIAIRPLRKKKNKMLKFLSVFFTTGRSPGIIWPPASFLTFYQRAGHLEQLDHSRNPFRILSSSGRLVGTIRPLAKPFSRFIFFIRQVAWNN